MHFAFKTFAFGCLVLAAAACGGGGGSSTTGGSATTTTTTATGPTVAQACADQAHATCTLRDTCAPGYNNMKNYGTEMACEMRTALVCPGNLMATGTAQNPAHIESCVAAYPSYTCVDFFDGDPPAACIPPVGTLANGAACGASAQCTSTFCAVSEYQVCGTCAALPAAGATCQVQADCGRNLACAVPTGATAGTCAAFVTMGGMCLTGKTPCAAGLSCVGDDETTSTMGTCMTAGATVGAACDGSRKTAASCYADLGLVCIPTAKGSAVGTCQNVTFVAAGATCGDVGSAPITGFAECSAGGACIKAATTDTTGTCMAPAADGAACDSDPTKGPPCLAPSKCVPTSSTVTSGTCTLPNASTCK